MTPQEFLAAVLPDSGLYCLFAMRGTDGPRQTLFVDTQGELLDLAMAADDGVSVYYGCSTFKARQRTQDATDRIKSFWVDLDVFKPGERRTKHKYDTQAGALLALRAFCTELALPRPIVVNSGLGVHAYWVLTDAVPPDVWQPVADKLKAVCRQWGLMIDPACTADSARVLRIPGTYNLNHVGGPREVTILMGRHSVTPIRDFAQTLSAVDTPTTGKTAALGFAAPEYVKGAGLDDTSKALAGEAAPPSQFELIIASRSCAQLTHIYEDQADIPEPLWRAGLSIAYNCVDHETAIHDMSREHPGYSAKKTELKAQGTAGPMHCTTFNDLNPGVCEGCPHWGRITSPIQLGRVIPTVDNKSEAVVGVDAATQDERNYVIPEYPWPYTKGAHGEVVTSVKDDSGITRQQVVYAHPLYVVKRMHDAEEGEMIWMRLHLPRDGVREFSVPTHSIGSRDKLRDALSRQGVVVYNKQWDLITSYVIRWTQELQKMQKTELIRPQFGWTAEDTFIIGDREITRDGVVYSPPATSTLNVCRMLTKRGSLERWKKLVSFYENEGQEAFAFVFFAGFGAPLMRFTKLNGGVINMTSVKSGAGKSTLQCVINSIWGHPMDLLGLEQDTSNARVHRMGVLNSLPVTIDEVTNMQGRDVSDFMYAATSGRGKNRMEHSSNAERINNTSWCTLVITSSNSSFEDKLRDLKATAEGELMRLIEIDMPRQETHPKAYVDDWFGSLGDDYGLAGEIFMQYVVRNQDAVKELLATIQARIDTDASLAQRERIWSGIAAVAIAGGEIARALGLHNIDVQRIAKWVSAHLLQAKTVDQQMRSIETGWVNIIGEFLDAHQPYTLVLDGAEKNNLPSAPLHENLRELYVRIEPDTNTVYIASTRFRKWCVERQYRMADIMHTLGTHGVRTRMVQKRLSSGTGWVSAKVSAIEIFDPSGKVLSGGRKRDAPALSVVKEA